MKGKERIIKNVYFLFSLRRSAGFQDRQIRSLFNSHYPYRARFKELHLRYELAHSQSLKKQTKLREQLEELERREEDLEFRKTQLQLVMDGFFTSPRDSKIINPHDDSFFADNSGFLDSGNGLISVIAA